MRFPSTLLCLGIVLISLLWAIFPANSWGWRNEPQEPVPNDDWDSMRTFHLEHPQTVVLYVSPQDPQLVPVMEDSLKQWSQALNGRLHYTWTNNPHHAHVRVLGIPWLDGPEETGITTFGFETADIAIKTTGVSQTALHHTVLHELGHALGIAGHSPYTSDTMYTEYLDTRTRQRAQLSVRDQHAIQRLYSSSWQPGENLYAHDTGLYAGG